MKTVEYKPEYGEINFPEGFEEKLIGKSIEEQMEFYRITESIALVNTSYGEIDSEKVCKMTYKLNEYENVTAYIVKDNILVGVKMNGMGVKTQRCFRIKA